MARHLKLHPLLQVIHRARVFAYCVSALILASQLLYIHLPASYVLFLVFLLSYPYVNSLVCSYIGNTPDGVRYALLPDGCLVGVMIVVAEPYHYHGRFIIMARLAKPKRILIELHRPSVSQCHSRQILVLDGLPESTDVIWNAEPYHYHGSIKLFRNQIGLKIVCDIRLVR